MAQRELTFDDMVLIAAECPRGIRADVPEGWEGRFWLAATPGAKGYVLWSDDKGHWLRVDTEFQW